MECGVANFCLIGSHSYVLADLGMVVQSMS